MIWNSARSTSEAELLARAQGVAAGAERELESAKALLRALGTSPYLETGDLAGFYRQAVRTPRAEGTRIALSDSSGQMLVNTSVSFGTLLPGRGDLNAVGQVFESGEARVSGLHIGPVTHEKLIAVDVPVLRDGHVAYSLSMGFRPTALGALVASANPPGDQWKAAIIDGQGSILARVPPLAANAAGKATPEAVRAFARGLPSGIFASPGRDGHPLLVAYHRIPGTDWVATAGIRQSAIQARLWNSLLAVFAGSILLALVGLVTALYQARRISQAIGGLAAVPVRVVPGGLREAETVARSLASASDERERSEATLRTITDAMPQMVWATKSNGDADYFNRRWYKLTGTTPGQVMGSRWKNLIHTDDRKRAEACWRASLASGEPFEVEYRLRLADGRYLWTLGRALPVLEPETGAIDRWLGTCTDIEETVAAREAMARSRDDLEHLVTERSRELDATRARLAQAERLEALGKLAGGIAHDFNNVLQTVQGSGALIERSPGNVEDVRRRARMIVEAAERGSSVTRRLLAFSRRGNLLAEPLDAAAVLNGMQDILAHTLGDGIEIRVDVSGRLPSLLADKGQLETVLVNLATNGRDAMKGIGALTLAAVTETLSSRADAGQPANLRAGCYVRLSVSDTGTGMDKETLAHASEPFFTTKPMGKGTGLGLAMARGFAEQSGGGMHIESAPGRGTTVTLWFPVAPETMHGADPGGHEAIGAAGKAHHRLLVVDDDDMVRAVLTEQLEADGFDVLPAESAAAALALLDMGERVDLIVTDLSMPGMDGLTLIHEAQLRRPGLRAILLTGFADTDAAAVAVDGSMTGTFSLLRKPVEGKHLCERVATLLERAPAVVKG
jgi:PAS domain S-box-containing protein